MPLKINPKIRINAAITTIALDPLSSLKKLSLKNPPIHFVVSPLTRAKKRKKIPNPIIYELQPGSDLFLLWFTSFDVINCSFMNLAMI